MLLRRISRACVRSTALVGLRIPAVLLIAAQTNEWNLGQRRYGKLPVSAEFELPERLSSDEATRLVDLLTVRNVLSVTAATNRDYWLRRVREADSIMLVFLVGGGGKWPLPRDCTFGI